MVYVLRQLVIVIYSRTSTLTGLETLHWDECESGLFAFYMKPCQPAQYPATPLHPLKITHRKSPYDDMHPLVKPTPQLQTSNNEHLSQTEPLIERNTMIRPTFMPPDCHNSKQSPSLDINKISNGG